ncbi:unannotated protein [freshwater metagenome]|uniref:Unannotated protein n=1 Tax=freshwater metagenome TaxID=449393 RepID=A0A6J6GAZ1_9ZZZZ
MRKSRKLPAYGVQSPVYMDDFAGRLGEERGHQGDSCLRRWDWIIDIPFQRGFRVPYAFEFIKAWNRLRCHGSDWASCNQVKADVFFAQIAG